jgi:DNA-binding transcriptional MerR regulator
MSDEPRGADARRAAASARQGLELEQTIREALEAARKDDEEAARHQRATTAYRAYVEARTERLQAAEQDAMDEADREQQKTGRPWSSSEDRYLARRETGLAARDRFELDEPLLEFAEWVEAGSPERYQAKTPIARMQARPLPQLST